MNYRADCYFLIQKQCKRPAMVWYLLKLDDVFTQGYGVLLLSLLKDGALDFSLVDGDYKSIPEKPPYTFMRCC